MCETANLYIVYFFKKTQNKKYIYIGVRGNNKITFDFFFKKKENLYLEIENFTQNKKLNLFKNIYFLKNEILSIK